MASEEAARQPVGEGYHAAEGQNVTNGRDFTNGQHQVDGQHDKTVPVNLPPVTVSQVPRPPFMKLANPGPLGLIGFALTTFVLGLYQCGAG